MIGNGGLILGEFVTQEPHPLAALHDAILTLLQDRDDIVLFGAQAVNAWGPDPRMTQDVDIQSTRAREVAEEIRERLASTFHIAVRIREAASGRDFRVYQLSTPRNRNLADIRQVDDLPPARRMGGLLVAEPHVLLAQKVLAIRARSGRPKGFLDRRDLAVLLLTFPRMRDPHGPVEALLRQWGADERTLALWAELAAEPIAPDED